VDELGELLELLYSARGRFRTARGVLLHRWSQRLTIEAMKREEETRTRRGGSQSQIMFATRAGDEPEPPDLHEERTRFWWEPPDRLREEVESDAKHARTTVVDGELWWMYMPEWGAISNVELSDEERAHHVVGRGESFRPALDPSGLIGVLDIDGVEVEGVRLCVRARPRDDLDGPSAHFRLRLAVGADAYELLVDRERGTVLRLAAYLDGEEIAVTEVEEVVFDEDFPEATFVFVPPPGEGVRPPEMVSHREYSLEEAAEAASFRVFAVPELPEGHWRLDVRFHDRRERPPIPALVTLVYHRSDGQGALVISQRAAGEGAESWPAIDPQLEDVERDGVGYTILRGDREHGGSGVAFEREGTAIQLQSSELDVEVLLELAASLEPVG
jgi:outer membrane lipoprotein-sorting protein